MTQLCLAVRGSSTLPHPVPQLSSFRSDFATCRLPKFKCISTHTSCQPIPWVSFHNMSAHLREALVHMRNGPGLATSRTIAHRSAFWITYYYICIFSISTSSVVAVAFLHTPIIPWAEYRHFFSLTIQTRRQRAGIYSVSSSLPWRSRLCSPSHTHYVSADAAVSGEVPVYLYSTIPRDKESNASNQTRMEMNGNSKWFRNTSFPLS